MHRPSETVRQHVSRFGNAPESTTSSQIHLVWNAGWLGLGPGTGTVIPQTESPTMTSTAATAWVCNLKCILQYRGYIMWNKIIFKLDSLRWFSQRRSPTPHFCGGAHTGGYDPQIRSRPKFLYNAPTPSFIIICLLVRKLSCWQTNTQANKLTNKQMPLKASNALRYATTLGNYFIRGRRPA